VEVKGQGLSSSPGPDGRVRFNLTLRGTPFRHGGAAGGQHPDVVGGASIGLAQKPGRNTVLIVPQLIWVGGPGAALTKDMPTEVFNRVGEISFGCYGRDRLGCFNVPGVLAAAEPGAAPDRGRITVSRDDKLLQRPRQVSFGG
jgi:hypothetical protein